MTARYRIAKLKPPIGQGRSGWLLGGVFGLLLGGCNTLGGFAGAVSGIATGTATTNPAVGYGVGIGVQAAVDATGKYVFRKWQQAEQDEIAALVGQMREGEIRRWQIRHTIPYGNNQGEVQITRSFQTPLAPCKEALFSVVEGEGKKQTRQWFIATICQQAAHWKWAVTEPAVQRWGSLH